MSATLDEIRAFLARPECTPELSAIVRWQYGAALEEPAAWRQLWRVLTAADDGNRSKLARGAATLNLSDLMTGDDYACELYRLVELALATPEPSEAERFMIHGLAFGFSLECYALEQWAHGNAGERIRAAGLNI